MSELPQPPAWHQAASAETTEEWVARHFVPAVALPGYLTCLLCACPVVAAGITRHYDSVHRHTGF